MPRISKFNPVMASRIIELCSLGYGKTHIAKLLDVSRSTLDMWISKHALQDRMRTAKYDYMRNTIERGLVALSEDDAGRVIRVTEKVRILPPNEKAIQILCKKYAKVFATDAVHEDAAPHLTLSINTNAMSLREIQQLNASSNPLGDASKVIDAECNDVTLGPPTSDTDD